MHNIILLLLIIIPVTGYATERYLEFLNSKMWSDTLPSKLSGICDADQYRKTQLYQKDNNRLSLWTSTFNTILILLMITAGGFAFIDGLALSISANPIIVSLVFFGIIGLQILLIFLSTGTTYL
jgi:STE24 endopeptidase